MSDAEREAAIRQHVAQVRAMAPYDAENVQGHVTFLLRLLDGARAEIKEQSEQLFALANELREARAEALEQALKGVNAIHEGKDGSRDPAVVDNTCVRIKHALRALLR